MEEPKYCPQCGTALEIRLEGGRPRPTCPACGFIYYRNPVVAVGALVEVEGRVALIRRGVPPRAGYWGLPAGWAEAGETTEEAAIRETLEEAGLNIAIDELLNVYSFGGGDATPGVLVVYSAHVLSGELRPGDDASEAAFFSPTELPADGEIAFWTHRQVLLDWRRARAVIYKPADEAALRQASELALQHDRPAWEVDLTQNSCQTQLLVAEDRDRVVGYAGLNQHPQGQARLEYLFVAPNYRRWGIGTRLIENCVALARHSGISSVVAEVEANNPAVAVYLKAGFHVCGFLSSPAALHGETVLIVACDL